jgi:hypothetical protein
MIFLVLLLILMGAHVWFFGRGPSTRTRTRTHSGSRLASTPPFAGRRVQPAPEPTASTPDAPVDLAPIWTALDDLQLTRLLAQAAGHHPSGELT